MREQTRRRETGGRGATGAERGFTLIEMTVVLLILAIIIAIIIPAFAHVRNTTRSAGTRSMMNQISAAASTFETDERRGPGYFSAQEMGSSENASRGFSSMQNVLLDLTKGITSKAADSTSIFEVGPTATATVNVNVDAIGASTRNDQTTRGAYYVPDAKFFVKMTAAEEKVASEPGHRALPDLVDYFGNPILAWGIVEGAKPDYSGEGTKAFAEIDSGGFAGGDRPFVYYAQNAAFLKATGTGRAVANQNEQSLLGGAQDDDKLRLTLAGVIGHPAFPTKTTDSNPMLYPAAARAGKLVLHSAGPNGVFVGKDERGGKIASGLPGADSDTVRYSGTSDPLDNFDDLVSGALN